MKATIEAPIERKVTIEMTESEAKVFKDYFDRQCMEDTVKIINKYNLQHKPIEVNDVIYAFYKVVAEVLDGEGK